MISLRRLALAFPLDWSHRRQYSVDALEHPGKGPYYIAWDAGTGTYGEDWAVSPRDANGVLLTYRACVYHPIRIAQYALAQYGVWCASGDDRAREEFILHAEWLRNNQRDAGGIPGTYVFDFAWPKYGAAPGWRSAMAQGEALSVLLRAEHMMPGSSYGDAAERAAAPFFHSIQEGGVVWRSESSVFLEEIANEHAPHVLNGCIFALWGAWELQQCTGDARLAPLVEQTVQTLRNWLPRFDSGWWSLYSLMRCANGRAHVATLKYHAFHIAQLRVLARMFGDDVFTETADRWSEYLADRTSRARVLGSNAVSLYDRARRLDTVAGGAHT